MAGIDRRNALRGILWGVAIVAGGAAVMPNGADAMEFVNGGDESLQRGNLYTRAQVVVLPSRRRRRWVCWWHRGRRVCGWR